MEFIRNRPNIIHLDINSCFATIEQQANPILRGRPIAVAAYTTNSGVILAASVDAKKIGINPTNDGIVLSAMAVVEPESRFGIKPATTAANKPVIKERPKIKGENCKCLLFNKKLIPIGTMKTSNILEAA